VKIGIPRALYYYEHYPFWETYFHKLGFEIVLSRKTNKEIMDWGVFYAVDGACLPVKIYHGHVYDLVQKNVDYIFIPRIISVVQREYICPKFMGLPDMICSSVPNLPTVLVPVIDARRNGWKVFQAYFALGRKFASPAKVVQAYYRACKALQMKQNSPIISVKPNRLTLGILGHEYLIYDDYLTMGIVSRLKAGGYNLYTLDSFDSNLLKHFREPSFKRMFWTSGRKIINGTNYLKEQVDGFISLVAFSCGTDSLVCDLVERFCQRNQIPHLLLNLDEHTGQAGIFTRLEAFLDMLERRAVHEVNCSSHGELLHSL